MNTRATAFPLRVQVCNLNPTFYPFERLINGMTLLYYQKQGSGYKPEPAGVIIATVIFPFSFSYAIVLTTTAGLIFVPVRSAKGKGIKTISPLLYMIAILPIVINCVFLIFYCYSLDFLVAFFGNFFVVFLSAFPFTAFAVAIFFVFFVVFLTDFFATSFSGS